MKKILFSYFFFLLSSFLILSSGVIDSIDGLQYLAVAREIYYKGTPTAPPNQYKELKNIHMSTDVGKDGNTYSLTGLGYSLAMLPAVALTDAVYKIYDVLPAVYFPLENDWLILLLASFTNAFFGAILGVTLFVYLIEVGLFKKQALFISFVGFLGTNLLIYAKHAFAQMMFVSFLFLSFYLVKRFFRTKNNLNLILAGVVFGASSITYNQTFILALIPLFLYFILLSEFSINLLVKQKMLFNRIKYLITRLLTFFLGFLPFIIIYIWFENLRAVPTRTLADPLSIAKAGIVPILNLPITVFFEGLYGQLFSPGRSIFLYSPILLLIIFFWHKIKKIIFPELVVFIVLSAIYIIFYSAQYSIGSVDQGIVAYWHGESSWGPRYLLPLIPFGLLIIGHIFLRLNKSQKLLIFLPLLIIGFYIEILGVLIPYQTKFYNLVKFYVNGTEYTPGVYSNLLPRYSPIIKMTNNLIKSAQNFPNTFNHGVYNVKFYDGIELPFNVGPERWREVEGRGYISFDNDNNTVKDLTFGLINHPISESSESANLKFTLNDEPLVDSPVILAIRQRESVRLPVKKSLLKPKDNNLVIDVSYDKPEVVSLHTQILGFQFFEINGQRQNMESLDIPYVSPLGPKMMGITYQNWGGSNKDSWRFWSLHSQIFERVPDFWWLRNLYHWDIPKEWIFIPLSLNITLLIFSGYKLKKTLNKK